MAVTLKPLHEQVIVITGASSGIGLATAYAAAQQGARLVLLARNAEALDDIVARLAAEGCEAVPVPGDVGRREDLQRAADTAVERFGGFDTWVNNAGVSIWGRLEEISDEDHRRLFDTNFWGVVYGSTIAVAHLKERGGALVNVGSLASDLPHPIQGMYAASKHAVKGFTNSLRMELEADGAPISVTLIKPGAIDTLFPQHARKYTEQEPKLPPPLYDPKEVANAILHATVHPKRDIYVGGSARTMSAMNKYAPRLMDLFGEKVLLPQQLDTEPARDREGAVHRAGMLAGRVHGHPRHHVMKTSAYTRASLNPLATGAALAAGIAAATWLGGRRRIRVKF